MCLVSRRQSHQNLAAVNDADVGPGALSLMRLPFLQPQLATHFPATVLPRQRFAETIPHRSKASRGRPRFRWREQPITHTEETAVEPRLPLAEECSGHRRVSCLRDGVLYSETFSNVFRQCMGSRLIGFHQSMDQTAPRGL